MKRKNQPGCVCCIACSLCYDAELPGNKAIQVTFSGIALYSAAGSRLCGGVLTPYPRWTDLNATFTLLGPPTNAETANCDWRGFWSLMEGTGTARQSSWCQCALTFTAGELAPAMMTLEVFGIGTDTLRVYQWIYAAAPLTCISGTTNTLLVWHAVKESGVWECADLEDGIECTCTTDSTSAHAIGVDFTSATALVEFPASQPSPSGGGSGTPNAWGLEAPYSVASGTARVVMTLPWPPGGGGCAGYGLQYYDGSSWVDLDIATQYAPVWDDYETNVGAWFAFDLDQSAIADAADDDLEVRLAYQDWFNCGDTPPAVQYSDSVNLTVWDGSTNCADYHERDPDVC